MLRTLILCLLLVPGVALAHEEDPYKWTTMDTTLLVGQLVFTTLDISTTMKFTQDPAHKVRERNPLLGPYPSRNTVRAAWVGSMALQAGVAYLLPKPYRTIWQTAFLTAEAGAFTLNIRYGFASPW